MDFLPDLPLDFLGDLDADFLPDFLGDLDFLGLLPGVFGLPYILTFESLVDPDFLGDLDFDDFLFCIKSL